MRDFLPLYKKSLYDEGTDSSLQQLGEMNDIDAKMRARRPILERLLDEPLPFHQTITPPPPGEPMQVVPAPRPPIPQRPRSILKKR